MLSYSPAVDTPIYAKEAAKEADDQRLHIGASTSDPHLMDPSNTHNSHCTQLLGALDKPIYAKEADEQQSASGSRA